jgi:hypothetical protein
MQQQHVICQHFYVLFGTYTSSGGGRGRLAGARAPGPCKENFPSLSLYKIIKILIFLKYFFLI